jgi:hypothetical protein
MVCIDSKGELNLNCHRNNTLALTGTPKIGLN